jgi:hypothetical protein
MSVLQGRGGIPRVFRATIDTDGREHQCGKVGGGDPFVTSYVVARNRGDTNIIRMYFTEADFVANANYVELTADDGVDPRAEWQGPVEAEKLWFRAAASTSPIEVTCFQRRG